MRLSRGRLKVGAATRRLLDDNLQLHLGQERHHGPSLDCSIVRRGLKELPPYHGAQPTLDPESGTPRTQRMSNLQFFIRLLTRKPVCSNAYITAGLVVGWSCHRKPSIASMPAAQRGRSFVWFPAQHLPLR
jgi:hypothetical protein